MFQLKQVINGSASTVLQYRQDVHVGLQTLIP